MYNREIDEQLLDVLQNIECLVAVSYDAAPDLSDYSIMAVYESLINVYTFENTHRTPRPVKLSPQEQTLADDIKKVCDWRMGRIEPSELVKNPADKIENRTLDEILSSLKILLKSVKYWNKAAGQQGYLNYISQFV